MHSYQLSNTRWMVFHYRRVTVRGAGAQFEEDKIIPITDFDTEAEAAAYVSYLNGGSKPATGE